MSRITLISAFKENELYKIKKCLEDVNFKTCKVSFGINDNQRYELDNLPYHQEEFIKLIKSIKIEKICLKVNQVKVMNGKNNSYVLYLGIEENKSLKELQREFYKRFPKEHYNPDNFTFHITLHIDKDSNRINDLQKEIIKRFEPFYIEFDQIDLFDYPGEKICSFNFEELMI